MVTFQMEEMLILKSQRKTALVNHVWPTCNNICPHKNEATTAGKRFSKISVLKKQRLSQVTFDENE